MAPLARRISIKINDNLLFPHKLWIQWLCGVAFLGCANLIGTYTHVKIRPTYISHAALENKVIFGRRRRVVWGIISNYQYSTDIIHYGGQIMKMHEAEFWKSHPPKSQLVFWCQKYPSPSSQLSHSILSLKYSSSSRNETFMLQVFLVYLYLAWRRVL